jgi:hypothetical protein
MPVRVRTVGNGSVPLEAVIFKVIHRSDWLFFVFNTFLFVFKGFPSRLKPLLHIAYSRLHEFLKQHFDGLSATF